MIAEYVSAWEQRKQEVRHKLEELTSGGRSIDFRHETLVRAVVSILPDADSDSLVSVRPDEYQGTAVYVWFGDISRARTETQRFFYVAIEYGSCSVCDSVQAALAEADPNYCLDQLMALALHVVQRAKPLDTSLRVRRGSDDGEGA